MRIVTDDRCKALVEAELGGSTLGPYACIGLERDGEVCMAFLFNNFTGNDAHVTAAGSRTSRRFLIEVGRFAFGYLGCRRLTFTTEAPKVIEYVERLGGKIEGCLRNHFGEGRDGIVLGILESEWKFKP